MEARQKLRRAGEVLLILLIVALSVGIFLYRDRIGQVSRVGYLGLMGLCFLANATVFLPAPSLLIAASCALIMDPLLVALCASFGSALGEMVGYLLGRTGQDLSPRFRDLAEKLRSRVKNELLLVFILALLPLPLFDFAGVWCGGTRQHPVRFFLACFAGKFLKMLVYTRLYDILAWAGEAYGLDLSELIP